MPNQLSPGVFIDEIPSGLRTIDGAPTAVAAFVGAFSDGPVNEPVAAIHMRQVEHHFGGPGVGSEAAYAVRQFFINGGQRAVIVRAETATASSTPTAASLATAMSSLEPRSFNLLCIPAMSNLGDREFAKLVEVANRFCEQHRAFLLIDPNVPDTTDAISGFDISVGGPNNAIYFPRVVISDPLDSGAKRTIAASGTVAGVYARTDAARGVWKAPAGLEASLQGVLGLAGGPIVDSENEALNQRGINVLRTFAAGPVVWGARTGDGQQSRPSEWRYVPVRRVALFIEESLIEGLAWAVFEPNDEPLWTQMHMSVTRFMHGLFRLGAFQGTSEKEAYMVRGGRDTTTQAEIDQGVLNLQVGFAPLRPAEFVVIKIQLVDLV